MFGAKFILIISDIQISEGIVRALLKSHKTS